MNTALASQPANYLISGSDNSTIEMRNVPQTSERLMSDFNGAERLALYDFAVAHTLPPAVLKAEELNMSYKKDEGTRAKTKLELLMEMRDAKRRRISYRSKKVHTNRKSHVEILREVIQNQMDFLREINGKENEEDEGTRCSEAESLKVENDRAEIGIPKWKQGNGDTKDDTDVCRNSADCSKVERYDSKEWYTTEKSTSKKKYSEIKAHNSSYGRDAAPRYDKYEQCSTSKDVNQSTYDDHFGTGSEIRREKSTNWYSKRKRKRSESSDWDSGDNGRARKMESTYYETEHRKHHKKHYHTSKFHSLHESSFSKSEKRTRDGMKQMYEHTSSSRSEYDETSKCGSKKQKLHGVRHKRDRLKATSRMYPRSDSESSEFSCGKQTVPEHKTSHAYAAEEYVHDEEEYTSHTHYSYWNHSEEEKQGSERKRKHHKKKKKRKKSKHEDDSSTD